MAILYNDKRKMDKKNYCLEKTECDKFLPFLKSFNFRAVFFIFLFHPNQPSLHHENIPISF